MRDHPAVKRCTALVEEWNAGNWGWHLLYETLEGTRDRPFKFLPALSAEDMALLKALRDDLKIWPYEISGKLALVPIETWRLHANETTADMVREGWVR